MGITMRFHSHFTPVALLGLAFLPASVALGLQDERSDKPKPEQKLASPKGVDFLRDIRPILSQHCFQCHGPDEGKRKAKMRLDVKSEAFAERKNGKVLEPGSPENSLLYQRLVTENDKKRMPPEGKAEPLSEKEIATIRTWIEQGAHYAEHWAFKPVVRPEVPEVQMKDWPKDKIDNFVLSKIEKEGLQPNEDATKEAWLRRASFDLTGLPPTPAEIDAFLKDSSPSAFEKQVDRLLESPRYGERQAQEWLDLARYADTNGYQNDTPRKAWKWREWVINAYNSNMPFDQFTIEQLAGDLLPNATLSQRVATGFNRNNPVNSEAGAEEDEYRSAYVIDRVNTTSTVFLGLTLACAQCHDHKYDPITQKDYYSFYSFFNNINERDADIRNPRPVLPVPNPDQEPKLKDIQSRVKALETRLKQDDPIADANQKEWEKATLERLGAPVAWTVAEPAGMLSRNGSLLKKLDDGSILSTGPAPVHDTYDIVLQPGKKHITALKVEVLPHESQPEKGVGRASDGRFILTALELRNSTLSESQEPPLVYISRADADLNQKMKEDPNIYDMIPGSIDNSIVVEPVHTGGEGMGMGMGMGFRGAGMGWSIVDDERLNPHEAILLPLEPLDLNDASVLRLSLHHSSSMKFKSLIGRLRISYTEEDRVRSLFLPAQTKLWSSIGPFQAEDTTKAFETVFEPEKDVIKGSLDLKKSYDKVVVASAQGGPVGPKGGPGGAPAPDASKAEAGKTESAAPDGNKDAAKETNKKEDGKDANQSDAGKTGETPAAQKTEKVASAEKQEKPAAGDMPSDAAPASDGAAPPDAPKFPGGFKKGGPGGKFKKPSVDGAVADAADGGYKGASPDSTKEQPADKADATAKGGKLAQASPKEEKKGDGAGEKPADKKDEKKPNDDKKPGESDKPAERKRPEKIAWTEQPKWRDGSPGRIDGVANGAFYLTRKIVSTAPRTAMVKIDGPSGVKVWLNGEPIYSVPPPPAPPGAIAPGGAPGGGKSDAAEPKKDGKGDKDKDKKAKKDDEDEPDNSIDFDDFDFATGRMRGPKEEKKFRMGLRKGENDLVIKVVFNASAGPPRGMFFGGAMVDFGGTGRGGAGGSITFDITPEGDDVVNYEVASALRAQAADAVAAVPAETPPAERPNVQLEASAPTAAPANGTAPTNGATPGQSAHDMGAVPDSGKRTAVSTAMGEDVTASVTAGDPTKGPKQPGGDAKPEENKVSLVGEKSAPLTTHENAAPVLPPAEKRKLVIREYYRTRIDPIGRVLHDELQKLKEEERLIKKEIPETLVMEEREKARQAYIFKRGLYKNKGASVDSNTPAILPPMAPDLPKNRLGLAKWLVARDNPLMSRVVVNRLWQQYFGTGLVRTAEDFGVRAEVPANQELLDYIAAEFMEGGWDLKKLHKRIVLSATYRQSSTTSKEKMEKDPQNLLLARGPHLRLTAEMVRDNALAVSGLLFEKIGGESVKPYQPKNAWKTVDGNMNSSYRRDRDEKQYRRGIYVYWKRGSPYPSMLNFDASKRENCVVARPYTTTPLQALTMLNDPVYVECAKMLGQRMLKDKEVGREKDDAKRLVYGFRLCTSRVPTDAEMEVLKKHLADQREHYKSDPELAKKLLEAGDAKVDEKIDAAESAAWASVGSVLLNLDATIRRG